MTDDRAKLSPFLATMLVAGGMIGSGIFLLPASLGAIGSISMLGWLGAAIGATLLAGVFSWLAILRPGGGLFSYIADAFGPGIGFVVGVIYWYPVTAVPIALAVTGYLSVFVPQVASGAGATIATIVILWLFVGINMFSARLVARFGGWTLALGAAPVVLIATFGWFAFDPAIFTASWNVSGQGAFEVLPNAVVIIFWAFVGIESAVIVAPLLRDPARDAPLATFGGLALATVLYLLASGAIMGILPAAVLAKSSAPFADAAKPLLGASIAGLVALCAMLKAAGTLGGTILVTVETAESDAVLGQILPNRPPQRADRPPKINLLFTGVVMSLVAIASTSPSLGRQFAIVVNVAVVLNLLTYLAACLALVRFAFDLRGGRRVAAWAIGAGGALFSCWAIAVSESDLLIWSVAAVAFALLLWVPIRLRQVRR